MKILRLNAEQIEEEKLKLAVKVLKEGGIVSYPTETFYGLAVDPFNKKAAERIYRIKGRDFRQPLLLIISEVGDIIRFGIKPPPSFQKLSHHFWPGPLTIALPAPAGIPEYLIGEGGGVAFRLSSNRIARELSRLFGRPITGTSANRSGAPPHTTASEVVRELESKIDIIIDGGKTEGGAPSTVIDLTMDPPKIIREGAIGRGEIEEVLGVRLK